MNAPPNRPAIDTDRAMFTWNSRLAVGLIVAGFLGAGVLLFPMFGLTSWAILIVVMAGCMMVGNPRVLLLLYWVWIVIYQYISALYYNMFMKWSDEAIAMTMLGVLIMHHIQDRSILSKLRGINRVFIALCCLIFVSAIANSVPKLIVLHFCLQYLRFLLLFYFTYVFVGAPQLKYVYWAFTAMVVVQFLVNFGWYLGVNPLPHWMSGADFAIGTGLGANVCAYYSIVYACMLIAHNTELRGGYRKILLAGMLLLSIIHLYVTFTYHAYLLLPMCVGLLVMVSSMRERRTALFGSLGAAFLVVLVILIMPLQFFGAIKYDFSPQRLEERAYNLFHGPKGKSYIDNITELPAEVPFFAVGAGPGNAGSNVAGINRRYLAEKYFVWVALAVERQQISYGGSIVGSPMTGILTIWSELGPIGLLLYWGLHVYAVVHVWRGLRRKLYQGKYKLIMARTFVPIMIMYILISLLADYAWLVTINVIWILAGAVWRYDVPPSQPAPAPTPQRAAGPGHRPLPPFRVRKLV